MKKCIFPSFSYNTISKKLFPDFSGVGQVSFYASGSRYVGERILVNLYLPVALKSV